MYGFDISGTGRLFQGSQWVGVKKKETETAPGQAFGRFLDGFCAQIDREIREIRDIREIREIR